MNGNTFRRTAQGFSSALEGFDVFECSDGRGERVAQDDFFFTAPEAGHDEYARTNSTFANGCGFFRRSKAEPFGSGLFESLRAAYDSVTVGVALYDGTDRDIRRCEFAYAAKIVLERRQRNFSPVGASVHREFLLNRRQMGIPLGL